MEGLYRRLARRAVEGFVKGYRTVSRRVKFTVDGWMDGWCKIPLYNPNNPGQPRDQSLSPVTQHSSFLCASSSRPVLSQCHSALLHSQMHREH